MNIKVKEKSDDFAQWAQIAFEHHLAGRYEDALTNMRKSGEAVCKAIFLYKLPYANAETKITNKSYKELIQLLSAENHAPRKVINWLETFQIHGNIATHDN